MAVRTDMHIGIEVMAWSDVFIQQEKHEQMKKWTFLFTTLPLFSKKELSISVTKTAQLHAIFAL